MGHVWHCDLVHLTFRVILRVISRSGPESGVVGQKSRYRAHARKEK